MVGDLQALMEKVRVSLGLYGKFYDCVCVLSWCEWIWSSVWLTMRATARGGRSHSALTGVSGHTPVGGMGTDPG